MKKVTFFIIFSWILLTNVLSQDATVSLIPMPNSVQHLSGDFTIKENTTLDIRLSKEEKKLFEQQIANTSLPSMRKAKKIAKNNIIFKLVADSSLGKEGYQLSIIPDRIIAQAQHTTGLFYALQTISQLYEQSARIPAMIIKDVPDFSYRGLHLDVSRHFVNKEFILKQISALARYKINRLHLHLTDGAGWRIEIKKYPKLTTHAAWRPYKKWEDWKANGSRYGANEKGEKFGGYYTQDDIREILSSAAAHNITVIPEIEIPGHSEEVLATYPELACTCANQYPILYDYCIGTEKTFEFLENVLTEIIDLFPSEYIHIGGDEATRFGWMNCERCQNRMKLEGLKNASELQSYCIRRIEKFINSKGRKMIGWEEILEGGLAPNAIVMTWMSEKGAIQAAKTGHYAIMTPSAYCYFDSYQDAPMTQPEAVGGLLPLKKVYSYNPIPKELTPKESQYILGVQSNVWTEYMSTPEYVEYMIYPRILAIAENGWTSSSVKCWKRFHREALRQVTWLQKQGFHPFDLSKEVGDRPAYRASVNHLALHKNVVYNEPYSPFYTAAKEKTLVDGAKGNWMYTDGRWQGFANRALDVTIDLDTVTDIQHISAEFMQFIKAGIYLPGSIEIYLSADGVDYKKIKEISHKVDPHANELFYKKLIWEGKERARYIRYVAKPSPTSKEWIFTDEIEVR